MAVLQQDTIPATMSARKRADSDSPPDKKPYGVHRQPRESFHLPEDLQRDLERCVDASRPRTNKTEIIKLALEEYLTRTGFRTPPSTEAGK